MPHPRRTPCTFPYCCPWPSCAPFTICTSSGRLTSALPGGTASAGPGAVHISSAAVAAATQEGSLAMAGPRCGAAAECCGASALRTTAADTRSGQIWVRTAHGQECLRVTKPLEHRARACDSCIVAGQSCKKPWPVKLLGPLSHTGNSVLLHFKPPAGAPTREESSKTRNKFLLPVLPEERTKGGPGIVGRAVRCN